MRSCVFVLIARFWCGMYNHYDRGMHPKQSVLDTLLTLTQRQVEGERTMTELQRVSGVVVLFSRMKTKVFFSKRKLKLLIRKHFC